MACVQHAFGGVKFQNRLQAGSAQSIFVVAPLEAGLIASQRRETYTLYRDGNIKCIPLSIQQRQKLLHVCVHNCTLRDNRYTVGLLKCVYISRPLFFCSGETWHQRHSDAARKRVLADGLRILLPESMGFAFRWNHITTPSRTIAAIVHCHEQWDYVQRETEKNHGTGVLVD